MNDYIKRENVINELFRYGMTEDGEAVIRSIPAEDVAPVRHGKWELHNVIFDILKCTVCGSTINCNEFGEYYKKHWKFCPNCGAKMEDAIDV